LGISPEAGGHDFLSGDPIELTNYLIEDATGKPIPGRDSEEVTETFGGPLVRL
jgi:hypothetical protein